MLEFEQPLSHEFDPSIKYPDGWREILDAPDTEDYRNWLDDLCDITKNNIVGHDIWWDEGQIDTRWQMAIETVANAVVKPEDLADLAQGQIIEAGLIALQLNIESIGWLEEGLSFTVPDMFLPGAVEEANIDLRDFNILRRDTF